MKYLEETAFDSDGRIFRNDHGKFLAKSSFSQPQQSNGKNDMVKSLFIGFLVNECNLFIFHHEKMFFDVFLPILNRYE